MTHRTCEHPGCNKPHRARGLCASHYNQVHAPNRHKKKLVKCAACGAEIMRASGGGRVVGNACSNKCRAKIAAMRRGERGKLRTELPADHWARWYGKASTWPRYGISDCGWCGEAFVRRSARGLFCSLLCVQRDARGVRRAQSELSSLVRDCVRCGAAYQHPRAHRAHCSDLCRELDRKDRGAELFRGWISKAERVAIYERDAYTCMLCNEPVDLSADPQRSDWSPTLDHIIPRSKGGTHDADNLRTAHRWCNSIRGDRDDAELFELAT